MTGYSLSIDDVMNVAHAKVDIQVIAGWLISGLQDGRSCCLLSDGQTLQYGVLTTWNVSSADLVTGDVLLDGGPLIWNVSGADSLQLTRCRRAVRRSGDVERLATRSADSFC